MKLTTDLVSAETFNSAKNEYITASSSSRDFGAPVKPNGSTDLAQVEM
jgi:hypothetical protein